MIFVSGLHIVIVVIFPFELLGLGERIHTLGVGNWLLDPVSKIYKPISSIFNFRWADQCDFGHDTVRGVSRFSVGQNVYEASDFNEGKFYFL